MSSQYEDCLEVTEFCVVEATTYGYRPNLASTIFFIAIFGVCMGLQLLQGIRWRTWFYMSVMTLGCLGEVVGELMTPFSSTPTRQLTCVRLCRQDNNE